MISSVGAHRSPLNRSPNSLKMKVDTRFFLFTFILSAIISFYAGRAMSKDILISDATASNVHDKITTSHPTLSLYPGKIPPLHKYSGIQFNDKSHNSGRVVSTHLPSHPGLPEQQQCKLKANGEKLCIIDNTAVYRPPHSENKCPEDDAATCSNNINVSNGNQKSIEEKKENDDNEEHLPAGQHLLIDIKNVDSKFLDSDVQLTKAMVDLVTQSELTLLSYHCHSLIPRGVSCVGVLLESHISFHTWPEAGVISLDLFTCGSGQLVPLVKMIESIFAVPQSESTTIKPCMRWVHKLRGFRSEDSQNILLSDMDFGSMLGETFDLKTEIATVQTDFQRIDIFDVKQTFEKESLLVKDPLYKSSNSHLYEPERIVYLDGVIQSTRKNLEAYHEGLVHPAMFANKNPKNVAIIGGGEGATLKEVLKHNTLQKVKMIEIDEQMVYASREYLPEWSDCSDIIGSEKWCGDDKRAEMYYEDALGWFIDRYSETGKFYNENHTKLDVIIMDALDPQDDIPFAEILYTDKTFLQSLFNSLEDDGIIVFQLGEAPDHDDPPDFLNRNSRRATLIEKLEELGFLSFHIYEEGHCGFYYPWTFLVVMKDSNDDSSWYRNEAEMQLAIHKRAMRSYSGNPVLKYFDGSVMKGYQIPHRVFQTVFCHQSPTPEGCSFDNEKIKDVLEDDLEVKTSNIGDGSGRGVFTKVDIVAGMSIGRKEASKPVYFPPSTTALIINGMENKLNTSIVYDYMDGYGWQVDIMGEQSYYVDSSLQTFMNHGCNGSFNIASKMSKKDQVITEQNAKESDARKFFDYEFDATTYNPYRLRHLHHISASHESALYDIKAGEELLTDYLDFQDGDEWFSEAQLLKSLCNGDVVGFITEKEQII